MFKCLDCDYNSNRRYNLKTHILRKHKREIKEEECIKIEDKEKSLKCLKCNKEFKSKQGLNYHINICKEVSNKLECEYCHKVYSSPSSKCNHLKICRVKLSSLIEVKKEANEVLEENTIINNINNGTINNITNNNITINFNTKPNEYTKFISDHILDKEIIKMIKENKNNSIQLIEAYLMKLYDNPVNQCIRKLQEKSPYSEVIEVGEWKKKPDSIVYPHLVKDISFDLAEKMYNFLDENKIKGVVYDEMNEFLNDIMVHKIDKEDLKLLLELKEAIKITKCVILNKSK
jgi:hypothetical protein